MFDVTRNERQVIARESEPYLKGCILFYGSSTFTFWKEEEINRLFYPYKIKNNAFGGSTAYEASYYFDRLIKPYEPVALCYYEGDNDMRMGFTPEEAFCHTKTLLDKLCVPIFIISVKHSPSGPEYIENINKYNELCYNYSKTRDNVFYVDIVNKLYIDQELSRDFFREDMLHLNEKGYEILYKELRKAFNSRLGSSPLQTKI